MLRDSVFNYSGHYLIVLTETTTGRTFDVVSQILSDCWSLYIVNVYILTSSDVRQSTATLYTYFPFAAGYCERVHPIVVNYYTNDSFVMPLHVFVDKFRNMHKCSVIGLISNYPPFTILTKNSNASLGNRDGMYRVDGIEGMLINELADFMNFTFTIRYEPPTLGYAERILDMVNVRPATLVDTLTIWIVLRPLIAFVCH